MAPLLRRAGLALILLLTVTGVAQAQGLEPFYGRWEGGTVLADDPRAASVTIAPTEDGGFDLRWQNYAVDVSETGEVEATERENAVTFRPTTQGGWIGTAVGGASATARLTNRVLEVTLTNVTEAGELERQIYRREVVNDRLSLGYTRLLGNQVTRTLTAVYVKVD